MSSMIHDINWLLDKVKSHLSKDHAYISTGIFTPAWTALTVTGAPIYTGRYKIIGKLAFVEVLINPNGGTTASTLGTSYVNNLPFTTTRYGICSALNETTFADMGRGVLYQTNMYTPAWGASANYITIQGWVEI